MAYFVVYLNDFDYYIWLPYSKTYYGSNLCMKYDSEIMETICDYHTVTQFNKEIRVLHIKSRLF
jgi:hypothetical protein